MTLTRKQRRTSRLAPMPAGGLSHPRTALQRQIAVCGAKREVQGDLHVDPLLTRATGAVVKRPRADFSWSPDSPDMLRHRLTCRYVAPCPVGVDGKRPASGIVV